MFTTTHNARLTIFYLLAMALLAGFGLDELAGRAPPAERRRLLLWICAALLAVPLVWLAVGRPAPSDLWPAIETAWLFVSPSDDLDVIRLASLILWLTFAGAALALVAGRLRGRIAPGLFAGLAIALVVLDLFRIGVGLNPAIEKDDARQPATGAIEYLQERRPARFVGASQPEQQGLLPLEPNLAMRYGLYDARGYDFPLERRYSELWNAYISAEEGIVPPTRLAPINERSLRALSLLGVADVVASPDAPPLREPRLRLAYDGDDAKVYENARALPRAFVVGAQQVVTGEDEALEAVTNPGFDGRRTAVVEEPLDGLPEGVPPAGREGRDHGVRTRPRRGDGGGPRRGSSGARRHPLPGLEGKRRWRRRPDRTGRLPASRGAHRAGLPRRRVPLRARAAGASDGSSAWSRWRSSRSYASELGPAVDLGRNPDL